MKLIEVSPISASIHKDSLTYYSAREVKVGDVVNTEVRKKLISAIVLGVSPINESKGDIKTASFGLKKIESVKGRAKFYPEFFEACREASRYFIGNVGQVMNYFIPSILLEKYDDIDVPKKRVSSNTAGFFALQRPLAKRIDFYKKYISDSHADGKSVHLVLPTIKEVRKFEQLLRVDIENIFTMFGSEKKIVEKYNSVLQSTGPTLLITTPAFLFIPRHDIGTYIVEHESSSSYRTIKKPYFDIRTFAGFIARHMHTDLIFADDILSVETIARTTDKKTLDFELSAGSRTFSVSDMTNKENLFKKSFVLSNDTASLIREPGRTFLFALRKGLSTQVVCHDCKHVMEDDGQPLVIHERDGKRTVRNAYTRKIIDENLRCPICNSWNFDSLGIGTETVTEEVRKLFPKKKVFHIDKEVTGSEKKAKDIAGKFYAEADAVLVGTEMALAYLTEPIDNSVIISMETLQNIPSYKAYERMLHLSLAVTSVAEKNSIIQTRTPDNPILSSLTDNDLENFFRAEVGRRELFRYPPFSTIIKLTHVGKESAGARIKEFVDMNLSGYHPNTRSVHRGPNIETNILIKLPASEWNEGNINTPVTIDLELAQILSGLGPEWQIRLNPENLF